jgi:mono/diheme cytochrome c family protein
VSIVPGSPRRRRLTILLTAAFVLAGTSVAEAIDPAKDFKQNCSSCHTIGGGRITGPDLKDVTKRKDRAWLARFIRDPAGMVASGDAYALKLFEEARNVQMPNIAGMTAERVESLLNLIEAESKLEKSQFVGLKISDRPFTAADIERGRRLFTGVDRLKNGGPSCISCHTLGGLGALGGGRLGPDLTKVFERYEDRMKLGMWLSAPATQTMLPTFRDQAIEAEEILPLIAYFQDAAKRHEEDTAPRGLVFLLLGLGGAAGAVLLLNRFWRFRFRGVRRSLVKASALPPRNPAATPNS